MGNFEVFRTDPRISKEFEFLLNVQSPLLSDLKTRLVIPLVKNIGQKFVIRNLNPEIEIHNQKYIVLTQQMAAVPVIYLGEKIEIVEIDRTNILSAIDFLITGF